MVKPQLGHDSEYRWSQEQVSLYMYAYVYVQTYRRIYQVGGCWGGMGKCFDVPARGTELMP